MIVLKQNKKKLEIGKASTGSAYLNVYEDRFNILFLNKKQIKNLIKQLSKIEKSLK